MLKSELVSVLRKEYAEMPVSDLELVVNLLFDAMADALDRGETVEIRGLGRLAVVQVKPRKTRNPRTGERVTQPARRRITFRAGKNISERINR